MSLLFKMRGRNGPRGSAIAFGLLVVAAVWPNLGVVAAFAAEKVIEVEPQHRNDAVAITKVTLGSAEVQCGLVLSPAEIQPVTPIQAGDDWLQNVTIYLLNRTNKTIVEGQIVLVFPETGDGSPGTRCGCTTSPSADCQRLPHTPAGPARPLWSRPACNPSRLRQARRCRFTLATTSTTLRPASTTLPSPQ